MMKKTLEEDFNIANLSETKQHDSLASPHD